MLYIFWLLHQTTTIVFGFHLSFSCISFDSYIKPQHNVYYKSFGKVVYLLTPTSNHNSTFAETFNTTLYIFWLLHQTTTGYCMLLSVFRCISFDSYIKPQPLSLLCRFWFVVYLLTPTSNHNQEIDNNYAAAVVYLLTPTSNHNS